MFLIFLMALSFEGFHTGTTDYGVGGTQGLEAYEPTSVIRSLLSGIGELSLVPG